jgi:hypothetical protein
MTTTPRSILQVSAGSSCNRVYHQGDKPMPDYNVFLPAFANRFRRL